MSIAKLSVYELSTLAQAGGGFTVSIAGKSAYELGLIAAAAANGGARVTFTDVGRLSAYELGTIAKAGKGLVAFVD
ncbi:hypothetical protein [Luteibacter sp. UNC138MFCol5.1]|uniref:hypothetical protein n=1 Tax=Luteibacter sp. UNC138MFCol5.1 TaxID=1502774 RepID=UPI000B7D622C|nr:hypothetical protein [Luteibacter sp. UNC138MFCol5.1]